MIERNTPVRDEPALAFGDWCRLNSGGPPMLVVDLEPEHVVCAWGPDQEAEFSRVCVRRCRFPIVKGKQE